MKSIIKPVVVLTLICLIVTGAVAGANLLTKDAIAANDAAATQDSMKAMIPGATFTESEKGECDSAYKASDSKGYVFVSHAYGYGGDVNVMTAVDNSGKIIGVSILSCDDETPGLGQNCKKDSFTSQFKGKSNKVELKKNGGEIDAITSATFTSNAVRDSVNKALKTYAMLAKGGGDK